jgi:hypothetical protein
VGDGGQSKAPCASSREKTQAEPQRRKGAGGLAHYGLSGGPMMQMSHSNGFDSSTSPAEKPSTGNLFRSAAAGHRVGHADMRRPDEWP